MFGTLSCNISPVQISGSNQWFKMSDWKKFQEKMKNKRLKKGKKEQGSVKTECETIVVQRLSAEVAGKAHTPQIHLCGSQGIRAL